MQYRLRNKLCLSCAVNHKYYHISCQMKHFQSNKQKNSHLNGGSKHFPFLKANISNEQQSEDMLTWCDNYLCQLANVTTTA